MKPGDILIYIGGDDIYLNRGDRVMFSQRLSTNTYYDTVIYTYDESGQIHYRIYPCESFRLLSQIRDEKIDTLLRNGVVL